MRLLEEYVERHNAGVRSGDFGPLLELFAADAVMRFEGFGFGPLASREAIAAAFAADAPTDGLLLLDAEGRYAWASDPERIAGTFVLTEGEGLIRELVVSRSD